ncbi:MAG: AMP-binding protein, partial [Armatimonadota bacterium]
MLQPPSSLTWMPEWLQQRATLSPQRLALIAGQQKWTFAELNQRVSASSHRLLAAGVHRGDHVALLARNGAPFVQLAYAVTRIGGVLVPLNIRLTASELSWQVRDAGAALLVYDEPNAAKAASLQERLPHLRCLSLAELAPQEGDGFNGDAGTGLDWVDLSTVHSIIYTAGTTGRPKG